MKEVSNCLELNQSNLENIEAESLAAKQLQHYCTSISGTMHIPQYWLSEQQLL